MILSVRLMTAVCAGAVLVLAGCASSSPDSSAASVTPDPVGTWGETAEKTPQLIFASDGTLTGTDGCNGLGGGWEVNGDQVDFVNVVGTFMYCEDVDMWLNALDTATIDGDTMTVMDAEGAEIGTLAKQPE